jgi:deazaflavin-dependent oxidoreductase (nitroreductase family)
MTRSSGLRRALYRAPILIYRLGLGGLLGGRLVLLTHLGRRTGRPRHTVLEVVGRDGDSYLVPSGYGARAQWYRNVQAEPRVRFQVGRRVYTGRAEPLPATESGRRLATYARRHPRTAAALMRVLGHHVDGSAAAYERLGADAENGVPIVALRTAPGPGPGSSGKPHSGPPGSGTWLS